MAEKTNIPDSYFELIAKELSGEISEKEKSSLLEWVNKEQDNRMLYEEVLKNWKVLAEKKEVPEFDTELAWSKLKARTGLTKSSEEGKVIPLVNSRKVFRVAAAILLLIGMFALAKYTLFNAPEAVNFATTNTKMEIYLPDSSKVLLNKNSRLTYYTDFNSEGRKVYLEGEAFFEVRKSEGKKFEVFGVRSVTTVLGTSFSVRSLQNEAKEVVQVLTGRVSFADKNNREKNEVILTPGFKGELDQSSMMTKDEIKDSNFVAWKEERLVFDNTELSKVAVALEEYFGIEIEVSDPLLLNCRFTGTFNNPRPDEVLEVLAESTNSSYKITGNKIILTGSGCSK
jgi:transmembrane sensor